MRSPPPRRRRGRAPRYPTAAEVGYRRDLQALATALGIAARAALERHGSRLIREAGARGDDDGPVPEGWAAILEAMLAEIIALIADQLLTVERTYRRRGREAEGFNRRDWHAQLRATYGVDIYKNEAWLPGDMSAWERENLALVRSLPADMVDRLRTRWADAVRRGASLREMAREVQETTGAGRKRADLLARDQIGKLNGQLQRRRQQDIGVTEFVWRTVGDERVRASHRARDGRTYRWDGKEPKPGEEIRCRCSAAPILPGLTAVEVMALGTG